MENYQTKSAYKIFCQQKSWCITASIHFFKTVLWQVDLSLSKAKITIYNESILGLFDNSSLIFLSKVSYQKTSIIKHCELFGHCPDLPDIPWTPRPPFWGSPGSSASCSCGSGPRPWWTSGAPPPQGCSPAPRKKIIGIQIIIHKLI